QPVLRPGKGVRGPLGCRRPAGLPAARASHHGRPRRPAAAITRAADLVISHEFYPNVGPFAWTMPDVPTVTARDGDCVPCGRRASAPGNFFALVVARR